MGADRMPIGVFTSVGAGLGAAVETVTGLDVSTVQFHAPHERTRARAKEIAERFEAAGITPTLVFCGFPGESYESIPIVRETVGLVPPRTREERLLQTKEIAQFASWVGAPAIGIHVGFIPERTDSAEFAEIVEVIGEIADYCDALGLQMNLETGQETAQTLLRVLQTADRDNLGVNFDPANMILYGSGEPLEALQMVGHRVRSVHCKDATWADRPGQEWGEEVPLGEGDVNIREFVAILERIGYANALTIEREVSGERQIRDIKRGIEVLRDVKQELGI